MLAGQELKERGDELTLINHINTDDAERENWKSVQEGKGFIRDSKGSVSGRIVARIPPDEAAMLETMKDLDYLSFSRNGDKAAFRRLLKRFPHWRCCEGSI